MKKEKLRLSTSRIQTYLHCPKEYWWIYEQNLSVTKKSAALEIGSLVHLFTEMDFNGKLTQDYIKNLEENVKKEFPNNSPEEVKMLAYEALNLYSGFKKKMETDPYETISAETHLILDMKDFDLYTRLDSIKKGKDGRLWRGELKTAGKIDSAYLSGLKGGLQAGISYLIIKEVLPFKVTGTIYDIIVKTKVPQYERSLILAEKSLLDRTKQCIKGVYQGIKTKRFYPSMQCFFYNRECDYLPLCRNDTPATREAFYEPRKEFYDKVGVKA